MKACQKNMLDTNVMIHRMDRIRFLINEAGRPTVIRNLSSGAKKLFCEFAMNLESFEEIARDFNGRHQTNIKSEIWSRLVPKDKDVGRPKRGHPPRSKNKKTLKRRLR